MKLSLCFTLLLATSSVFAGPESLALAGKVIEANGTQHALEDSFMKNMESAMAQLKKMGGEDLAREVTDVARQFFKDNYKWDELSPLYAEAYAAEFSDDELKSLLAFYESPLGKKAVTKLNGINLGISQKISAKIQDKMPQLQAEMMNVVKKHLAAKQEKK